jgi:entericidin B
MRDIKNTKWFLPALAALAALTAAACNTVAGAGQDIQSAGSAVTSTAQDTQDDLQKDK